MPDILKGLEIDKLENLNDYSFDVGNKTNKSFVKAYGNFLEKQEFLEKTSKTLDGSTKANTLSTTCVTKLENTNNNNKTIENKQVIHIFVINFNFLINKVSIFINPLSENHNNGRKHIKLHSESHESVKMNETYVEKRYCTVCNLEQPIRSKHCKSCGRCVALYDHHCPWMGT